jgi:crotonobetainyl-CoA:carnitine CoA-transferase CaiB-like acyl-CoA transferase
MSTAKPKTGPLEGIRILDLSRLYPGPLGTMLMADMGADVIKIEDPNTPDYMRSYPPFAGEQSAGFLAVNRSKRSLALNLRTDDGKRIFFELIKTADIVVESYRPGRLKKMGLDYEKARAANPKIIYVSVTGYGQDGPYSQKAGHDLNYLAHAGILALTGSKDSGPAIPGVQMADVAGGAYMTVVACLSALWARVQTGQGQHVDVAMLDSILPLMTLQWAHFQALGAAQPRGEMLLSGGLACYNVYECADGKYVALGALEAKFWQQFCKLVEHPEWIALQFAQREEAGRLKAELRILFKSKSRDAWLALAGEKDICLSPVMELDVLQQDAHLQARKMFVPEAVQDRAAFSAIGVPLKFSATPAAPSASAPKLGQHTGEILRELRYVEEIIEQFAEKGIIM